MIGDARTPETDFAPASHALPNHIFWEASVRYFLAMRLFLLATPAEWAGVKYVNGLD
jgi:hypothetical protein